MSPSDARNLAIAEIKEIVLFKCQRIGRPLKKIKRGVIFSSFHAA